MKLPKSQLKQIIIEELNEVLPARLKEPWSQGTSGGEETLRRLAYKSAFGRKKPEPVGLEMEEDETDLIIAFQELFDKWQPQTEEGHQYKNDLEGVLRSTTIQEGKRASKSVGDPPYRERGSTESQAQQKAAGMALSARRGDTPVSKLKGAALGLYHNEITTKELRNLAKLGQKVKQHKSKEPKHLKSLPGHATPAKD